MGTLFVVATPIGNLEDVTPRALRVLREVALIAAEDTRRTRQLLGHFGIATRTISYHAHNQGRRRDDILAALAAGDVALVSDAGTPGISDPGTELVAAARAAGYPVSPVAGPSALAAAVSASGLVPGPFLFLGFLPRQGPPRRQALARAIATGVPLVLFEAPPRLAATLADLAATLDPERPAAVLRELTKLHEEIRTGSLRDLATWAAAGQVRGEVVIVVGAPAAATNAAGDDPAALVRALRRAGLSASEAAREAAAATGRPRSAMYALAREWAGEAD